jgi:hypothetical protein
LDHHCYRLGADDLDAHSSGKKETLKQSLDHPHIPPPAHQQAGRRVRGLKSF